jgi:hypothetical protein
MGATTVATRDADPLARTVDEILEAQRRSWGRGRWRALVTRIDAVIDECEREHLAGVTVPSLELQARGRSALGASAGAVAELGNPAALATLLETAVDRPTSIVDLMDALWAAQDVVLDVLMPSRASLPVDVPVSGLPRFAGRQAGS